MDREEKVEAVQELKNRVEDWKGHRVEGFGDLMLYGTFTVLKSDTAPSKDGEREVSISRPFGNLPCSEHNRFTFRTRRPVQ